MRRENSFEFGRVHEFEIFDDFNESTGTGFRLL